MRFCPHCSSLYRGDFEHCAVDGSRLDIVGEDEDPLLGRPVDRYRIEALLGTGSTGRVYRAVHRTREETFALKVIWGDLGADQRLVRRFQRAAAATRCIHHTNVVRIMDFGTTIGGLSFLVMELVEGESLRTFLRRRGRLDSLSTARITYQIAQGLMAAHAAGFVHRDVKPANLVLHGSPSNLRVKILDFGLVGLTVADADARITASGTFVGTPLYMAPEQARNASEVGPAADVYALGVLIHELLTGFPPFDGGTSLEVMIAHSTRAPPPTPPASGLGPMAEHMLSKTPEGRPSLPDILQLLAGIIEHLETSEPATERTPVRETLESRPVPTTKPNR